MIVNISMALTALPITITKKYCSAAKAIPEKTDIIDAVLCFTITTSFVQDRFGKLKFIANPYKDTKTEKDAAPKIIIHPLTKGICIVKQINTEAKNTGARIVRLTNIFDANIIGIGTGRLFIIHICLPSIDIEAIVVHDVAIQNVIIIGIISLMLPVISIPPAIALISIKGLGI